MTSENCQHLNAYPSLDHAHKGGWYCCDCKKGIPRPAQFSPPPKKLSVSTQNNGTALLTETFSPPAAPAAETNTYLKEKTHEELTASRVSFVRKHSVSTSQSSGDSANFAHGVYEIPSKGRKYFRYVANKGHQVICSVHIPGGATNNPQAKGRADQVRRWIAAGKTPQEIKEAIGRWGMMRDGDHSEE